MTPWNKKKLLNRLSSSFGKVPDKEYYPGDMEQIRTFYDASSIREQDRFHVDETTWKDLNMDDVYKRVNACQCTAGEQYLYYMLRTPMKPDTYQEEQELIRLMETCPELRLKIQLPLSRIGASRDVDLTSVFRPADNSPRWLIIYSLMALLLTVSLIIPAFLGTRWLLLPLALIVLNTWVHTFRRVRCEHEINRVNYCVSLILALNRMRKTDLPELEPYLADA